MYHEEALNQLFVHQPDFAVYVVVIIIYRTTIIPDAAATYKVNLRRSEWRVWRWCGTVAADLWTVAFHRWPSWQHIRFNYVYSTSICSCLPTPNFHLTFYRASYASTVLAVIVCESVRLSVRLLVTSPSCTKMAKSTITLRTAYDSPGTLVFRCQKSWRNSNDITPNGSAK